MYRFIRTATVKNAALLPAALKFASQVTAHLNKNYGVSMRFGAELFGGARIHWHFEADSVDKMQQINERLMEDKEYAAMLEKFQENWVEGSMQDALIKMI